MAWNRVRALIVACHPGPTATVTVVVVALSAAVGRDAWGLVLMGVATLTGQLSIGWSNDARDAERDRKAARTGKPTVRGDVAAATLWRLAALALVATIVFSYLAAGPIGGSAHVVAVLSAWTYNVLLKSTVLSPLPYAVSFGLVPVFVTYGLTPPTAPAPWLVIACALLGVGAHLANAIPDVESDVGVGAGGLVSRVGVRVAGVSALVCVVAALGLLSAHLNVAPAVAAAIVVIPVVGAVFFALRGAGRGPGLFRYILVLAVLAVLMLLVSARTLTGS